MTDANPQGIFSDLSPSHYGVILADPPWSFAVRSAKGTGRSAEKHYPTMPIAEIKALPVADLAAKDAVLLMWVTDPFLEAGFDVLKAWGFKFKTVGFYWGKTNKNGSPFTGTGYWTRANPEQCLLATRGHPKRQDKGVPRLIMSQRREHSRKPDEVYGLVERLCSGPYVELFARSARPGWDAWGNQVGRFALDGVV
jgi:N6-adenosine-specific RNA methylase IME4